jgi:hypothetical protein
LTAFSASAALAVAHNARRMADAMLTILVMRQF